MTALVRAKPLAETCGTGVPDGINCTGCKTLIKTLMSLPRTPRWSSALPSSAQKRRPIVCWPSFARKAIFDVEREGHNEIMRSLEEALFNGRLGKGIAGLVGKPGSLKFRLARDTLGVMVLRGGSMGLGFLRVVGPDMKTRGLSAL